MVNKAKKIIFIVDGRFENIYMFFIRICSGRLFKGFCVSIRNINSYKSRLFVRSI